MSDLPSPARATSSVLATESIIDSLLDALDEQQLDELARRISTRRFARVEVRLLAALRADSAVLHREGLTDHSEPVTHVTFSTHDNDYDPVCWSVNAAARHKSGAKTPVDYGGTDIEHALRDYSSFTCPVAGSRLVVDLNTGQFTVRGAWEPE
ncbi:MULTISPECIES: hypothetical protein [unclassified Streptomyces]|uniref:Uncharacterized protein n=2 Tax=unclassified Streptomyces TaxID=2593676 RepID=V9Z4X8_9ACTN|nr:MULTISPECIES: hypothetical protein [unclassified Streptomyces]AHE39592.1 hypothetical protein pFRL4_359c [Streptomyces sp. F2]